MNSPVPLSRTLTGVSIGSPLMISPQRHYLDQHSYTSAAPPPLIPSDSTAGLIYASAYDAYQHHMATLVAHQHLLADLAYPVTTTANSGEELGHITGMIGYANR